MKKKLNSLFACMACTVLALSAGAQANPNVIRTLAPIAKGVDSPSLPDPTQEDYYESGVTALKHYVSTEYTDYVGNCQGSNPLPAEAPGGGLVYICLGKHRFSGGPATWTIKHNTSTSDWLSKINSVDLYDGGDNLLFSSRAQGLKHTYSRFAAYTRIRFETNTFRGTWYADPALVKKIVLSP